VPGVSIAVVDGDNIWAEVSIVHRYLYAKPSHHKRRQVFLATLLNCNIHNIVPNYNRATALPSSPTHLLHHQHSSAAAAPPKHS
jgi:hypothetical protein